MKFLKQGAEAVIYSDVIDGEKVLVKERIKKNYRVEQIDSKLRLERTRQELKLIREARGHGVPTPRIISSDEKNCKIIMEKLDGELMKDLLNSPKNSKKIEKVCFEVGKAIGKLHNAGIIHGDLTTSNMILSDGKVYLIDFGLGQFSNRIEDMAIDLTVLLETLRATHNKISDRCWRMAVKGYRPANSKSHDVMIRACEIEHRGRYKK